MRLCIVLLFVILVLFIAEPTSSSRIPRVVNGIVSQPGQWPFMAALYRDTNLFIVHPYLRKWWPRSLQFFCGAMVWDNQNVLTAAHCVKNKIANRTSVYLGHVDRTVINENYIFDVKEIIMHAQYNDYSVQNDIALLRLTKPINFANFTQKIASVRPLKPSQLVDPDRCVILGWGITEKDFPSMQLREADIYLKSCYPQCVQKSGQIEAGNLVGQKDSCSGDSGGPLLCALADDTQSYCLVGITSTGDGSCQKGIVTSYGNYTYVPYYINWIKKNVGETIPAKPSTPNNNPPLYLLIGTYLAQFIRNLNIL